jgi:hypothetical protein
VNNAIYSEREYDAAAYQRVAHAAVADIASKQSEVGIDLSV